MSLWSAAACRRFLFQSDAQIFDVTLISNGMEIQSCDKSQHSRFQSPHCAESPRPERLVDKLQEHHDVERLAQRILRRRQRYGDG